MDDMEDLAESIESILDTIEDYKKELRGARACFDIESPVASLTHTIDSWLDDLYCSIAELVRLPHGDDNTDMDGDIDGC